MLLSFNGHKTFVPVSKRQSVGAAAFFGEKNAGPYPGFCQLLKCFMAGIDFQTDQSGVAQNKNIAAVFRHPDTLVDYYLTGG